jgi:hypothetical protein
MAGWRARWMARYAVLRWVKTHRDRGKRERSSWGSSLRVAGVAECWIWASDEGEEQSRVELIRDDLWAWRGKTGEGNECGEEWGCSCALSIGPRWRAEASGRSNGSQRGAL